MPSKIQLDVNLWFLYLCLQNSDYKSIDFRAVGEQAGLNAPAARMRFTRLKKQIENGSLNGNLKHVLQPNSSRARKNNTSCTKKTEGKGGAINNLSLGTEEEHHQINRKTTRPGNVKINLKDSFDYGIPPEEGKNEKYESDGSLYVANDADAETDDDIPLSKRRKLTGATSTLKRDQSITQYVASREVREERSRTSLEFRRNQNQPHQKIEIISDDEDQARNLGEQIVAAAGALSGANSLARSTVKGQRQMSNEGANWLIENTKGKGKITPASLAMSPGIVASSVIQNDVFQRRQSNDADIAYSSRGPFLSSFRSKHIDNQDQGLTPRHSGGVMGIELGRFNGLTAPKPVLSLRKRPGADCKREGFMSWREMAERAKAPQKTRLISETKNINIQGKVTGQSITGCQGAQIEQMEAEEPTKSQALHQQTRPQISQIVIDLD